MGFCVICSVSLFICPRILRRSQQHLRPDSVLAAPDTLRKQRNHDRNSRAKHLFGKKYGKTNGHQSSALALSVASEIVRPRTAQE